MPTPSKVKELPELEVENKETPNETELKNEQPVKTPEVETAPEETLQAVTIPKASPEKAEKPSDYIEENCVLVGSKKIEIKPTKLKYFRNKAASAYGIIKAIPLHELLTYGKGVLDENRDADQLLYDFLVAAFDDHELVKEYYDDMDAELIEQVIKIFGRINHIEEKEEAVRKNKEAQMKR